MADEGQPLGVRRGVLAVVVVAAPRGRNQAFALVEADRFDWHAGRLRKVSDSHLDPQKR